MMPQNYFRITRYSGACLPLFILVILLTTFISGCAKITFEGGSICVPIGEYGIPGRATIGLPPLAPGAQLPSDVRPLPTISQTIDVSATFAALQTIAGNSSALVNHLVIMPITRENAATLRNEDGTPPSIVTLNSLNFIEQFSVSISAAATATLPALPSSNLVLFRKNATIDRQRAQPISILPTELQNTIDSQSLVLAGNPQTDVAPFFSRGSINITVNSQIDLNHPHTPNMYWGIRFYVCVRPVEVRVP